jgi:hypothetical protein
VIDRTTSARFPAPPLFSPNLILCHISTTSARRTTLSSTGATAKTPMRRSTPSRGEEQIAKHHGRCHVLGGGGQQPQPTEELKITQGVPSGASAETASDSSLLSVSGYFRTNQIKGGSLLVRLAPSLFPPLERAGVHTNLEREHLARHLERFARLADDVRVGWRNRDWLHLSGLQE